MVFEERYSSISTFILSQFPPNWMTESYKNVPRPRSWVILVRFKSFLPKSGFFLKIRHFYAETLTPCWVSSKQNGLIPVKVLDRRIDGQTLLATVGGQCIQPEFHFNNSNCFQWTSISILLYFSTTVKLTIHNCATIFTVNFISVRNK